MKVAHRLYLAILPAVLGVLTVAGLAYWGERGRQAPEDFVTVAAIVALVSLVLAWRNTRYVAQRIERLMPGDAPVESAGSAGWAVIRELASLRQLFAGRVGRDELDAIQANIDRLQVLLDRARQDAEMREREAKERSDEYARLLAASTELMARRLTDVRLPIHVLLENRFGDLNENQEEMLEAARVASEGADAEARRLHEVAQLDLGRAVLRDEQVSVRDILASVTPALRALAATRGVRLELDLVPAPPRVRGDAIRLREVIATLLHRAVFAAAPGSRLLVTLKALDGRLALSASAAPAPADFPELPLVSRIVRATGGELHVDAAEGLSLSLPLAAGA